jgi:flavin-dependent dehydrogenase
MYAGNDVSPDFYVCGFHEYDYLEVNIEIIKVNKSIIKNLQFFIHQHASFSLKREKIIKVKAYLMSKHPCTRRFVHLLALGDDAAGTVTQFSGEGIDSAAAESARTCTKTIVEVSNVS